MKRTIGLILLLTAVGALFAAPAIAEDYTYVGLKKCKMCHKPEKIGNQFGAWEAGPHAKAYADLTSEAGLAKAKELGVAKPAESDKCLACHSTGHGAAAEAVAKLDVANGVTCEACHGPGSGYFKKKTMADITAGTLDGTTVGLWKIDEKTCLVCHKADNPGHKGVFDYEKMIEKIAHPLAKAE